MSAPAVCRWGFECRRADCWFSHPTGRAIDQQPMQPMQSMPPMMYGNPMMQTMPMMPPMGFSGVTKPIVPGEPVAQSSNSSRSSGQQVCRWGRQCHRNECWFLHPEGRDIDDGTATRSSPGLDDYDDALDEFENDQDGRADEEDFNCPCCNGKPDNCQTSSCKAAGICACQQDRIVEPEMDEDVGPDAWKDEWFPNSRDCECCKGYVYNCKKSNGKCSKGTCFCKEGDEDVEAVLGKQT